jgi:SAUR family protein
MELEKQAKGKKNLLLKTWHRCRSLPREKSTSTTSNLSKSQSGNQVAPEGCFSVYVGPEKQRFVIKTKYANHPLFKMLLEDAEEEYGYNSEGPLLLPCDVDLFCKVLAEMDHKEEEIVPSCGFAHGSCSPFTPGRRVGKSGNMAKVYGSYGYGLLTPSRLLKMNQF